MKLKIDFHVHSKNSFDSGMSLDKIASVAKKKGLNAVVIADHDNIPEDLASKNKKDFVFIPGEEIFSDQGDIIGLFLKKKIKSRSALEVIKEIKKQGGIVLIPHPAFGHILSDEVIKRADLIEVFNSRIGPKLNQMAANLAKNNNKIGVAGSDAHLYWEIGNVENIINSKSEKLGDIKEAILSGNIEFSGKRPGILGRGIIKIHKFLVRK